MREGGGGYIQPLAPDGGSLEGGGRPASSAIVSTPSYRSSTGAKHPSGATSRIASLRRWANSSLDPGPRVARTAGRVAALRWVLCARYARSGAEPPIPADRGYADFREGLPTF